MNEMGYLFLFTTVARCARMCLYILLTVFLGNVGFAQEASVRISVSPASASRIVIEVTEAVGRQRWSFVDAYGSAIGLSERVGNFAAFDNGGKEVQTRQLGVGEYVTPVTCNKFRYEMVLTPPGDEASIAHVSWLTAERGVLMLGDLLPRSIDRVAVQIDVPAGWQQVSNERKQGSDFVVEKVDEAVFVVGREVRGRVTRIGESELIFAVQGAWAFSDDEAFHVIREFYEAHRKVVGDVGQKRVLISLQSFPQSVRAENWRSEVRGGMVNFFSGKQPSRAVALTRLSTAMAHELLHLWVPNGLALDGAYDWFYEGFVEYQAMRACVMVGVVSYQDYLNAMERAYEKHLAAQGKGGVSLVGASRRRWATGNELVYSDGLLVAFLYDLTLRYKSKNKRTMDDLFLELMRTHGHGVKRADGNRAVIDILNVLLGSTEFTKDYVEGAGAIDLKVSVARFGLRVEQIGARTRITVSERLNKDQASLQRKLGYSY